MVTPTRIFRSAQLTARCKGDVTPINAFVLHVSVWRVSVVSSVLISLRLRTLCRAKSERTGFVGSLGVRRRR